VNFPLGKLLRANLPEAIDLLMAYVEHRVKEEATKGSKGSSGWKGSWNHLCFKMFQVIGIGWLLFGLGWVGMGWFDSLNNPWPPLPTKEFRLQGTMPLRTKNLVQAGPGLQKHGP